MAVRLCPEPEVIRRRGVTICWCRGIARMACKRSWWCQGGAQHEGDLMSDVQRLTLGVVLISAYVTLSLAISWHICSR